MERWRTSAGLAAVPCGTGARQGSWLWLAVIQPFRSAVSWAGKVRVWGRVGNPDASARRHWSGRGSWPGGYGLRSCEWNSAVRGRRLRAVTVTRPVRSAWTRGTDSNRRATGSEPVRLRRRTPGRSWRGRESNPRRAVCKAVLRSGGLPDEASRTWVSRSAFGALPLSYGLSPGGIRTRDLPINSGNRTRSARDVRARDRICTCNTPGLSRRPLLVGIPWRIGAG
jgi:hypothetical protein